MVADTNILIAYLKGDSLVVKQIDAHRDSGLPIYISVINTIEILSLARLTAAEIQNIRSFLLDFTSIPVENQLAETAAEFRRRYSLSTTDAIIVATAYLYNEPLITRDKALHKVEEIRLILL